MKDLAKTSDDSDTKKGKKYEKYLNSDGEFLGWKKTAKKVLEDKNGSIKKKKLLKKLWKIYKNSS